ncbi:hypothetical protein [Abyssibius alkaniclasticus]|uniref:hypothetical protein n=1 Tax=Abyssibius alkaniclasticus TaxID=2881234 RepID=UPI0040598305
MRGGGGNGRPANPDLMLGEYGFNSRRAAASLPAEHRRNGLVGHAQPLAAARAKPLVIDVSPRRIFAVYAKNSALFTPVIFLWNTQLNKGETS